MTVYLVDFENVRSEGLRGVEGLNEGDKVVIFYSRNADAITFDVHMLLSKSRAEIETFRILRGGRNSLDFQLSTYMGYLVMENCYKNIVIISQDKGFLCATSFWEENKELCNCTIKLCKSIATSDMESSSNDEFDDGLTGKFIEKIEVRKTPFVSNNEPEKTIPPVKQTHGIVSQTNARTLSNKGETRGFERQPVRQFKKRSDRPVIRQYADFKSRTFTETANKPAVNTARSIIKPDTNAVRTTEAPDMNVSRTVTKPVSKASNKPTEQKVNLNIQNPTSKNKVFAAEVKLNVADDLKHIINGRFDEKVVPLLVETLGMSTGKQHFYRMLVSRLGQEQGHEIYMMIKGQYANLKRK